MKYKVEILETLRKVVEIDAESSSNAREVVYDKLLADELVLGEEDFYDVEIQCLPT